MTGATTTFCSTSRRPRQAATDCHLHCHCLCVHGEYSTLKHIHHSPFPSNVPPHPAIFTEVFFTHSIYSPPRHDGYLPSRTNAIIQQTGQRNLTSTLQLMQPTKPRNTNCDWTAKICGDTTSGSTRPYPSLAQMRPREILVTLTFSL